MVTRARRSPPAVLGYEPVPCCEFCLGEYLAGIVQQWRTPATEYRDAPQQGCGFDLCEMHYVWYRAFLREMEELANAPQRPAS